MSDSISQARNRLDQIKYYHEYAGQNSYSQAMHFRAELLKIYQKANTIDAPIINSFVKEANILMDEMKKRDVET